MEIWAKRCGSAPGTLLAGPGAVDTIFEQAINIRMHGGMCLSLVDSGIDLAPNRIVLPEGMVSRLPVRPGDHVKVEGKTLYHREFSIKFAPGAPRKCCPSLPSENSVRVIMKSLALGRGACLCFFIQDAGDAIEQKVAGLALRLIKDNAAAAELVGLGHGFTPAGDDVLVGYLALAHGLGWLNESWHRHIVEKALRESTALSATAIYFAGLGYVQEYLENVLASLGQPLLLERACRVLIERVGKSSGSDMLLGVLVACCRYLYRGDMPNAQESSHQAQSVL